MSEQRSNDRTEKPLVDRLRSCAGPWNDPHLAMVAADEIERLTTQNTRLVTEIAVQGRELGEAKAYGERRTAQVNGLTRERDEMLRGVNDDEGYEALKRDNERLRAALEKIAKPPQAGTYPMIAQQFINIARAALAPDSAAAPTCPHGYRLEDLNTGASVCERCADSSAATAVSQSE